MSYVWSILIGLFVLLIQLIVFAKARRSARSRGAKWMDEIESGMRAEQERDSAIVDLERSLLSCPHVSLLRKLGVVAPLLGVTLTALAFILNSEVVAALMSQPSGSESESSLDRGVLIQQAITPLFTGVLIGALLAIINQFLQALLAKQEDVELARASDPELISRFRDPDSAFERFADGIRESTAQLTESASVLRKMLDDTTLRMTELSNGAATLTGELRSGATSLREAIDVPSQELAAAAGTMRDAAQSVATKLKSGFVTLGERSLKLQQLLEQIANTHEAEISKFGTKVHSFEATLEGVRQAAEGIRQAMTSVSGSIDRLEGRSASELREHLLRLTAATDQYTRAFELASRASSQQATASGELVDSFEKGAEAVRQAAVSIQEASRPWWRRKERGS
jgi:methyl-accepting chemotaxis protein